MLPVGDLNVTVHRLIKQLGTVCGADHQSHHSMAAPPVLCIIPIFYFFSSVVMLCQCHTRSEVQDKRPIKLFCYLYLPFSERQIN